MSRLLPLRRLPLFATLWLQLPTLLAAQASSPSTPTAPAQGAPSSVAASAAPDTSITPDCRPTVNFSPGQGVEFMTCDGDHAMHLWSRAQLRYTLTHNEQPGRDYQQTAEVRRAALFLAGHAFNPHNKYFVQLAFSARDLGLDSGPVSNSPIFDMFLTFDYARDASLRLGQYKPFFSRQFIAGWGDLQFIDRSTVQNEFHVERDIGFDLFSNDLGGLGLFRYTVGLYANQGRNVPNGRALHALPVARLEFSPFGQLKDYRESDLERSASPLLSIGIAYAYLAGSTQQRGVYGGAFADGGSADYHSAEADLMFKWRGLSLTAEAFHRDGNRYRAIEHSDAAEALQPARNGDGFFVQGGFVLPTMPVEFSARGGRIWAARDSSMAGLGELGGAISYYAQAHAFKVQLDYFRLWQEPQTLDSSSDQLRMQVQLQM